MSVTTVSDTGPTVSVELWSLRDSCQVPALGDHEGLTELRRRGLGFREAAAACIRRAKHWRGVHCSLSSRELQGGIRVFGYKLCTCGLEKDRPENSRQGDSWRVHKAISEFYQLEWRNLNPHRALDWVLSHLSKHQADLQVTAHQNKIQYSLKEFNKIQHSAT